MTKRVAEQQIGGTHYKSLPDGYQPIQIAMKLGLDAAQFSILKYLLRYKRKNGAEDIKKLIHFAQFILELEYDIKSRIEYEEHLSEEDSDGHSTDSRDQCLR